MDPICAVADKMTLKSFHGPSYSSAFVQAFGDLLISITRFQQQSVFVAERLIESLPMKSWRNVRSRSEIV